MRAKGSAMLFLPPHPPLPLPPGGRIVIGRSRTCDITVRSADASRRHAEIEAGPAGFVLTDLDSTNGTFVNGRRVGRQVLRTGDRIEIGGDLVTFCLIDPALEAGDQTQADQAETRMTERPALGQCVEGRLEEIPPFAVLQMLELGSKSGLLSIEGGPTGSGRMWLVSGDPVHAETEKQRGFDAAVALCQADAGRFSFEPGQPPPERTIQASGTELLLEASRLLDEAAAR